MIAVSPAADGYVHGGAYKALHASILSPFFLTILLIFVSTPRAARSEETL